MVDPSQNGHRQEVNKFLNTEVERYIEQVVGDQHQYQPPYNTEKQTEEGSQKTLGMYAEVLQRRLKLTAPKVENRDTTNQSRRLGRGTNEEAGKQTDRWRTQPETEKKDSSLKRQ